MSDWLHNLPVVWMAVVTFGFTYMVAAAIYAVVTLLAVGERARAFKAVSPACCRRWASSLGFSSRSRPLRSGTITNGQTLRSIARPVR